MASEAKHTPGPWRFDHDWNRLPTVFGANGKKVCVIERDVRGEPSDEQKTDAELIASLPTLLAERDAALVAVDGMRKALGEAENSLSIAKAEIASLKNREVDMITMIFDLHCKLEEQASELSDNTDLPTEKVKG